MHCMDSVTRSSEVQDQLPFVQASVTFVNGTPCTECCTKDEFWIHRRHAAGGVCEQRMTALQNYIDRYGISVPCQKSTFQNCSHLQLCILVFSSKCTVVLPHKEQLRTNAKLA